MKNSLLLYGIFFLFLFSCSQKTEQEKILEKIEEDPKLFIQLLEDLNKISNTSIPKYIPKNEIPFEVKSLFPKSNIHQLMMVDLTMNGDYEACVLLDSINYKKIVILANESGKMMKINTGWLISEGRSEIKSQQRILAWEIQNKNQKQNLKFKYINPDFKLIKNERNTSHNSVDTVKNIKQEINYLTQEANKIVNIFLVQDGQNSNTTVKEKIEQDSFPLLRDVRESNRYLNLIQ